MRHVDVDFAPAATKQLTDGPSPLALFWSAQSPARSPFAMPKDYISLRTPVRRETPDYDLDSDDEDWLDR